MRRFLLSLALSGAMGAALLTSSAFVTSVNAQTASNNETFAGNTLTARTDVPRVITYQGVLTNSDGTAVKDGEYTVTMRIYSDLDGVKELWRDSYKVQVAKGIFNLALGSGAQALPEAGAMNQSLWLSMQIGDQAEMRPYSALTASAYALNVPDKSISANKISADYVKSITMNGQTVTGNGAAVNIQTGDGVVASVDPATSTILLKGGQTQLQGAHGGEVQGNTTISGSLTVTGSTFLGSGASTPVTVNSLSNSLPVKTNGSHQLVSGAMDLSNVSETDVSGILKPINGGTGINTSSAANGTLLIGNGTGLSLNTLTANNGITVTNGSGTIGLGVNAAADFTWIGNHNFSGAVIAGASPLVFDGATVDATNRTTFAITDPTAARTITFPDASGVVSLGGLVAGTTPSSTLRWNGTNWAENTGVLADASSNLHVNGLVNIGTTNNYGTLDVLPSGGNDVLLGGGTNTISEIKFLSFFNRHFSIYNGGAGNDLVFANTTTTATANNAGTPLMTLSAAGLNLTAGEAYSINASSVLNATTLGTGVVNSSLQNLGIQNATLNMGTNAITGVTNFTSINGGTRTWSIAPAVAAGDQLTIAAGAAGGGANNGGDMYLNGGLKAGAGLDGTVHINVSTSTGSTIIGNSTGSINMYGSGLNFNGAPISGAVFNDIVMTNNTGAGRSLSVTASTGGNAGDPLAISAGNAGTGTGGNVVLASGTGTTTNGDIVFKTGGTGGTTQMTVNNGGGVTVNNGNLQVSNLTPSRPVVTDGSRNLSSALIALGDATNFVAGTLAVGNGGTGQSSALTAGGVIFGSSTSAMGSTLTGTTTQVLHGNGGGTPTFGAVANGDLAGGTYSAITGLGTQAIALDMNSHRINNVTDPSGAQDAATKAYTDLAATAVILSPLSSGRNVIMPTAVTTIPLSIYGENGQTANLQNWSLWNGSPLAYVTSAGAITSTGALTSGDATHNGTLVAYDGTSGKKVTLKPVGSLVSDATYTFPVNTAGAMSTDGSGNISTGTLSIGNGGTGATTLAAASIPTGTGTANTMTKWTGTNTQGNSALTDDGSVLTYNGATGINANTATSVYQINGLTVLSAPGTSTFVGKYTGLTGTQNSFFGNSAGAGNTGNFNAFVGYSTGYSNTGNYDAFFGFEAGTSNTGGLQNTFAGAVAGFNNTGGSNNTFVGFHSGYLNVGGGNNTFVGSYAGEANTTGSTNTALGNQADMGANNLTNATAIGNGAIAAATDNIQLGNGSVTLVNTSGAYNTATGYEIGGTAADGKYLRGNGSNFVSASLTAGDMTGQISPANGGTGLNNPTAYGILVGEGAANVNPIVLGAGEVLIGTTASNPVAATLSNGTNISISSTSGSITVNTTNNPSFSTSVLSPIFTSAAAMGIYPAINVGGTGYDAALSGGASSNGGSNGGDVNINGGVPGGGGVHGAVNIGTSVAQTVNIGTAGGTINIAGGITGVVTSVSSGNLSPLFTSSVATATSTPAISYSLTTAPANTFFGNFTGAPGAPSYSSPVLASADFAAQGTTTQVLHGGGAGNPSWGSIVNGDLAGGTYSAITGLGTQAIGLNMGSNTISGVTSLTLNGAISGGTSYSGSGDITSTGGSINAKNGFQVNSAAADGTILRGNGANYIASTATYPNTAAQGDLLYASAANVIGNLTVGTATQVLHGGGTVPVYGSVVNGDLAGGTYSAITGVGTITSGIWNGTAVAPDYGGTGLSSYTIGDVLYASGATTLSKLADVAVGRVLTSGGVGAAPSYSSTPTLGIAATTGGTLGLANGGALGDVTTLSSVATAARAVVFPNAAGNVSLTTSAGTALFTGPTVNRTFTLPDGNATLVTTTTLNNNTLAGSLTSLNVNSGGITNAGAISGVTTLVTSDNITTGGHLLTTSTIGSATPSTDANTASVAGSDVAGTVTFTITNTGAATGSVLVAFGTAYASAPVVVISPANAATTNPGLGKWYVTSTTTDFTLTFTDAADVATLQFNYIVIDKP